MTNRRMKLTGTDMFPNKHTLKQAVKWTAAGLPIGGVVWASFLPLQTWMQQALVLIVLLWLQAFFLLGIFSSGN